MPSGGDWALERMGVLFFEGTENSLVDSCLFSRLDGNAIMVSGYNRNTTIQKNEFVWIGSSAIAQWGYTKGADGVPGMGWDATDGNQPRFSKILYNFCPRVGNMGETIFILFSSHVRISSRAIYSLTDLELVSILMMEWEEVAM